MEIALRALRSTNALFRTSLWNFLGVWIIGAPSVYFFGLQGVIILLSLNVLVGIELWRRYLRDTRPASMGAASGEFREVAIRAMRRPDAESGLTTEV
jgi:hypothetical protein